MQKRANFHLETYAANDTISKFEIAGVKNTDLKWTQSLVILHSKMTKCKMAWSEKFIAMGYIFLGEFENGFSISDHNLLMAHLLRKLKMETSGLT